MTNSKTTAPHYSHLKHGEGIVRRHFLNITAPIEINGKPHDKFSIRLNLTIGEKLRLCTYVSIAEGFTTDESFNRPQTHTKEGEPQPIYLFHRLLKNITDRVEFEDTYPRDEYTVTFKKKDNGYYLEEVSSVGSTLFFFPDETLKLIVNMFNAETELRNQLGW